VPRAGRRAGAERQLQQHSGHAGSKGSSAVDQRGEPAALLQELGMCHSLLLRTNHITSGSLLLLGQVLMVAPTAFGFNEQTAADNTFMHSSGKTGSKSNVAVRAASSTSVHAVGTCRHSGAACCRTGLPGNAPVTCGAGQNGDRDTDSAAGVCGPAPRPSRAGGRACEPVPGDGHFRTATMLLLPTPCTDAVATKHTSEHHSLSRVLGAAARRVTRDAGRSVPQQLVHHACCWRGERQCEGEHAGAVPHEGAQQVGVSCHAT
jgi:hypothetical protein